jgi:tellurite methyltransferase
MARGDRERWDERYSLAGNTAPSQFLTTLDVVLPRAGRALDVAGGAGRHAVWLARRGLTVTLVDVSPVALELASAAAARAGVALELAERDLDEEPLPPGPFDLVVCLDFLCRPLLSALPTVMAPGALLVCRLATRSNLARHPHPSARFLLEDGELPSLVPGLEVVRQSEGWLADGAGEPRHEARLLARRPG